jgi:putative sterol carrier protein
VEPARVLLWTKEPPDEERADGSMTPHSSDGHRSPTDAFFDDLATRGRDSLLKGASGTLRFDLAEGERVQHWYVTMSGGDVTVSHSRAKADAVLRVDKNTFDGMASGRVNAMAATFRGELVPEGDLSLLLLFQRLFPAPPSRNKARKTARRGAA